MPNKTFGHFRFYGNQTFITGGFSLPIAKKLNTLKAGQQWEKFSPLIPENSLELKQHRREILSMLPWFDFALKVTKGSWLLIRDGHQYSPAQKIVANGLKKQSTALQPLWADVQSSWVILLPIFQEQIRWNGDNAKRLWASYLNGV